MTKLPLRIFLAVLCLAIAALIALEMWLPLAGAVLLLCALAGLWQPPERLAIVFVGLAVLAPTLSVGGTVPFRPEDVALLMLLASPGIAIIQWRSPYVPLIAGLLLVFAYLMFLASLYGVLQLQSKLTISDVFSVAAVLRLVLIFLVGAALGRWARKGPESRHRFATIFLGIVGLASVLGLLQYWDIFGAVEWTVPLYRYEDAESHIAALRADGLSRRISGTVGNPNLFAYLLTLGVAAGLPLIGVSNTVTSRLRNLGFVAIVLFALILTLSRTGAVAMLVVLAVLGTALFVNREGWRSLVRIGAALMVLGIVSLAVPKNLTENFSERVAQQIGERMLSATSFAVRRDVLWEMTWSQIQQSPVFGLGPATASLERVVDNAYLYILRTTGFVGLSLWIVLFSSSGFALLRGIRSTDKQVVLYRLWGLGSLVATLIFCLTADILVNPQLMGIFWFVLAFNLEAGCCTGGKASSTLLTSIIGGGARHHPRIKRGRHQKSDGSNLLD